MNLQCSPELKLLIYQSVCIPHPALEWDCGYKGQKRALSEAGLRDGVKRSVSVIAVPVICQLRQLHSQEHKLLRLRDECLVFDLRSTVLWNGKHGQSPYYNSIISYLSIRCIHHQQKPLRSDGDIFLRYFVEEQEWVRNTVMTELRTGCSSSSQQPSSLCWLIARNNSICICGTFKKA